MYTVIGGPRTRAMRVLWMLEELEQPYAHVPAAPRSAEALAANPSGKVPSLLVDGETLTDSVAIVTYLADRHAAFTHPAGTLERARQDAVTQFCVDEIEGALWTAAKHSFIHPEELRVPEVKAACRAEFDAAMARLGAMVEGREFVAGDGFTVPDLLLGHCAGWAEAAKFDLPDGPAGAYLARMRARPALARAMRKATAAG